LISFFNVAPQTALAIVHAVTRFAPEPTRLDRYRNELAANLTGVPSSKANIDGLWLLRRLAAVAPDPASDIVFLPQQRAVQLVKACQNWVEADDDDDEDGVGEEVEGAMTRVFADLAPILQHVTGAHWDFIFDVIENNLEVS
jgi:E3 ubiquitin-protein ligase listerin